MACEHCTEAKRLWQQARDAMDNEYALPPAFPGDHDSPLIPVTAPMQRKLSAATKEAAEYWASEADELMKECKCKHDQ